MNLSEVRQAYFEIMNDPVLLHAPRLCIQCRQEITAGHMGFPVQNYFGEYVAFVCLHCHPRGNQLLSLWEVPTAVTPV